MAEALYRFDQIRWTTPGEPLRRLPYDTRAPGWLESLPVSRFLMLAGVLGTAAFLAVMRLSVHGAPVFTCFSL